jgi:cytochrome b
MFAAISYLANKPAGAVLVYLIVAAVLFGVAGMLAAYARDLWRSIICAGLVALTLAFLV